MNKYILVINATRDEGGYEAFPRYVGPFDVRQDALLWMQKQSSVYGSWHVSYLTDPQEELAATA